MAEYTVELRKIVESGINIFPFPYDFYDESKRQKFEQDFIRHFYFREIGCETVDRFIFFLEDKMNTVFPYYNELFKANQIEYDVLDNYKLTETITRKRENEGRSRGVSSTVGQMFDEQQTDTTETTNGTGSTIQNENGTSETVHNGTSETIGTVKQTTKANGTSETSKTETTETDTTNNGTVEGSSTKKGSGTSENVQNVTKKFLDTPQGLTDLTNSKYLTTLNQDNSNGTTENESNETTTDKQTTAGTGSSDTTVSGSTTGKTTDNTETDSESNSKTTTGETTTGETGRDSTENTSVNQDSKGNVSFKGEQKTTNDNNTRSESAGSESETIETVRRGNIGVDTDSDGIVKHLKLQQILKKIERMFFDECEDLFMGVF